MQINKKRVVLCATLLSTPVLKVSAHIQEMKLLNAPVDISGDFKTSPIPITWRITSQNLTRLSASGELNYKRYNYNTRQACSLILISSLKHNINL